MVTPSAIAAIPPPLLDMMARGVSVIVSSRDLAMRPSLARAMASALSLDGRSVAVYLDRAQSRQVLQDIAATGHVAAVFGEPTTHRTVQLKTTRAAIRHADRNDEPALASYLVAMEAELGRIGLSGERSRAMLSCRLDELVAVTFVPEQAFDQTPGPRAGSRLEAAP